MRGPDSNIYVVRGTFPMDCPIDYNDFGQWLSPDEARIITQPLSEVQPKQESNTAIEMASRRYLTVGIAAGLRDIEVPGTKIEALSQQLYQQKGMPTTIEEESEESDDDLKAAIAISLMSFEAPATTCRAKAEINLDIALSKDTTIEQPGSSKSDEPIK